MPLEARAWPGANITIAAPTAAPVTARATGISQRPRPRPSPSHSPSSFCCRPADPAASPHRAAFAGRRAAAGRRRRGRVRAPAAGPVTNLRPVRGSGRRGRAPPARGRIASEAIVRIRGIRPRGVRRRRPRLGRGGPGGAALEPVTLVGDRVRGGRVIRLTGAGVPVGVRPSRVNRPARVGGLPRVGRASPRCRAARQRPSSRHSGKRSRRPRKSRRPQEAGRPTGPVRLLRVRVRRLLRVLRLVVLGRLPAVAKVPLAHAGTPWIGSLTSCITDGRTPRFTSQAGTDATIRW